MSHEDSSRVRKVHLLTLGQPRILIYIVQKLSGLVPVAKALLKIVPARRGSCEFRIRLQPRMDACIHSFMDA